MNNDYNNYKGKIRGYIDNDTIYIPTDSIDIKVIRANRICRSEPMICTWEWGETERGLPIVDGGFDVYDENFRFGVGYRYDRLRDVIYDQDGNAVYDHYATPRYPEILNHMKLCEISVNYWGTANIAIQDYKRCKVVDKIYFEDYKVVEDDEALASRLSTAKISELEYKIKEKRKFLNSVIEIKFKDLKDRPGLYAKSILTLLKTDKRDEYLKEFDDIAEVIHKEFKKELVAEIKELVEKQKEV